MKNNLKKHIAFLLIAMLSLQSCNTFKHIPKDKKLFTEFEIQIKGKQSTYDKGSIKENLSEA